MTLMSFITRATLGDLCVLRALRDVGVLVALGDAGVLDAIHIGDVGTFGDVGVLR